MSIMKMIMEKYSHQESRVLQGMRTSVLKLGVIDDSPFTHVAHSKRIHAVYCLPVFQLFLCLVFGHGMITSRRWLLWLFGEIPIIDVQNVRPADLVVLVPMGRAVKVDPSDQHSKHSLAQILCTIRADELARIDTQECAFNDVLPPGKDA
jgi:hypothetical protein